jgi:hypothetical protein
LGAGLRAGVPNDIDNDDYDGDDNNDDYYDNDDHDNNNDDDDNDNNNNINGNKLIQAIVGKGWKPPLS